jgi:phosphoribosylformimino-5-aminoimidazole carboxamide ribotide isomerase
MIIYPAIDLKGGNCVRLYQGDMNQATIFNNSPASQAKYFEDQGFKFLHLVDLDGAINGNSVNENSIKLILKNISIPVQLGGGIRTMENIEKWLELGISRIIIGTLALKEPEIVKAAAKKFPGKIIVGIDAKDGMVATHGWVEKSNISVIDLAKNFADAGIAAIIYTDISRDGTMNGVDLEGTKKLAESLSIPVIASGGVASIEDIKNLKKIEKFGVEGAIVGRALYDKKIAVNEMLEVAAA